MAVAVRRNIHNQRDMEMRTPVQHGSRILRHLAAEDFIGIVIVVGNRIKCAGTDAAAAALADILVDDRLACFIGNGIRAAFLRTASAGHAEFRIHFRFSVIVLRHLARAAPAAHADVLDGSAKARTLMPFKMVQGYEYIRIHYGMTDIGLLAIDAVRYRYRNIIGSAQAVADDDLAARADRIEAVDICAVKVVQGILPASRIQRIAVRQEGHPVSFPNQLRHGSRVIRTEESKVPEFPEMHLDGYKLLVHVHFADSCPAAKLLQLFSNRHIRFRPEIRKIYF